MQSPPHSESDSDSELGNDLSFYYQKDENGRLRKYTKPPAVKSLRKTPTTTNVYVPPPATQRSNAARTGSGNPSPTVSEPPAEGSAPMTQQARVSRNRSESAALPTPSATVASRPFSRAVSSSVALTTAKEPAASRYASLAGAGYAAMDKENRHPLNTEYSSGRRTPNIIPLSGVKETSSEQSAAEDVPQPPLRQTVRTPAAVTRTPSVTATLMNTRTPANAGTGSINGGTRSVPRTGPVRVTPAEKARQEEYSRRELLELERQRVLEERRRSAEDIERQRLEEQQRREDEQRRAQASEESYEAELAYAEQLAAEQAYARQLEQQRQADRNGGWYDLPADPLAESPPIEQYQHYAIADDQHYQREREREREMYVMPDEPRHPVQPLHRRRESETAMPGAGPAVPAVPARHSPSAKHVRPVIGLGLPTADSNGRSASDRGPVARLANGVGHKRSPTAPEPRTVERERAPSRAEERAPSRADVKSEGGQTAELRVITYTVNKRSYTRVDLLGKGGSSRVYRVLTNPAASEGRGQEVLALKRVMLDTADDQTVQGFLNEIQLLRRLEGNKRVITLIDSEVQVNNGRRTLFMVMECGETDLAKLMSDRLSEPLEMDWVKYYWRQMLQAVQIIHDEKIVHSDLKPANFVLVKGCLKLIDFGIANAIANDTTNIQRDHQIGTVNFMSPEALEEQPQARRFKVGRPSDVWSLGCILYQMIYRQPPFASLSVYHKMRAIPDPQHAITFGPLSVPLDKSGIKDPAVQPARLEHLSRHVCREAIDTMQRCLVRAPKERATIPELLDDPWLTADTRPPTPASITPKKPPVRPASPPVPNPLTNDRMAYVDDHYMLQVVQWVVQKSGGKLTEDEMSRTSLGLVDELRRMFGLNPEDRHAP